MTEPKAYLAFWRKERHQWWARRYGHVTMFFFGQQTWVHIDVEHRGMSVHVHFTKDEVDDFLSRVFTYALVVRYPVRLRSHFFRPLTCVSFVKHAFGIRSCALSPDGLLRTLRASGEAEILNEDPEDRGIAGAAGGPQAQRAAADQDDSGGGG